MHGLKIAAVTTGLVAIALLCHAQKWMVKDGDTLPYKTEMVITGTDTGYYGACNTFDILNGLYINYTDNRCLKQGLWLITDSLGNYTTGFYRNSHKTGVWKTHSHKGTLLKEQETVVVVDDVYTVKQIDYTSGKPVTVVNKPILSFYLKNLFLIVGIIFISFFARVFLNSHIYNIENNTHYSPIYISFPGYTSPNYYHSLQCTFTVWFFNYLPQNRTAVIISNTLSAISLGLFFGMLILLALAGEL